MNTVVRPPTILGTPAAIAEELGDGWRVRRYPSERFPNRRFNWRTDFLMTAVPPQQLVNAPPEYGATYDFFSKNKYGQRRALAAGGIPTPRTFTERPTDVGLRFVVRPLRHSRGSGYRVTDTFTSNPGEYVSELYPKKREYRVIFVYGQPLIHLRKKPNEGVGNDEPWGHSNSRFQTINDPAGSRLARTDCVARLSALPVVRFSHIVAADILWNGEASQPYVVLELNSCPGLEIENNRSKIVEAISTRWAPVVPIPVAQTTPLPVTTATTPEVQQIELPLPPAYRIVEILPYLTLRLTNTDIDSIIHILTEARRRAA